MRLPFFRNVLCTYLFFLLLASANGQDEFIQVECNKTLGLFTFIEAAAESRSTSSSYSEYILERLADDGEFMQIVEAFAGLDFDYHMDWEAYPKIRHGGISAKDLLWVSLSQSTSISDFSQRFYGVIPMTKHSKLISIMKSAKPYFEQLVWEPQQANINRMLQQMSAYKPQIKELFLKVTKFYEVDWDQSIPFTIQLYPIPLERGMTTAIPKGNAFICAFLSEKENEHLGVLGIAIHEMCHIIYAQQTIQKQHEIDSIFNQHPSEFSQKAYAYLDEGLATALGNGWAYREVHGKLDTSQWYNHEYINEYAHAIFEDVVEYVDNGKAMDDALLHKAVASFEKTFPNANRDVMGLLNQAILFVNAADEQKLGNTIDLFIDLFNSRGIWMSSPVDDPEGAELFDRKSTSKFFILEQEKEMAYQMISQQYPELVRPVIRNESFLYSHRDRASGSMVFLIDLKFLDPGTLLNYKGG